MLCSAPYYWIACDGVGCNNTCPEQGDEFSAWKQPDIAEEMALEADWHKTDDERLLCEDCWIAEIDQEDDDG